MDRPTAVEVARCILSGQRLPITHMTYDDLDDISVAINDILESDDERKAKRGE